MTLERLEVRDLRCIRRADLDLDPRLTVFSGANASGKTSLLEAVHFLSCGRSFRTHRVEPLIRAEAAEMLTVGSVRSGGRVVTLGARAMRSGIETRVGGVPAKGFSELARLLPVQAIDPDVHKLLEEGPSRRRRFLDWGVFHVEQGYVTMWRRYQRALKQRNAALRRQLNVAAVEVWERDLADAGETLAYQRSRYLEGLRPIAAGLAADMLDVQVSLELQRGWSGEQTLAEALAHARVRDVTSGVTSVGPHRADLWVAVEGTPARDRVSRGQQKLLAAALVLAQLKYRARTGHPETVLLLDDPAAELDKRGLQRLLDVIADLPAQLVVSALDPDAVKDLDPGRVFHVEQGETRRVV
jgi:DNA replication and repair protein RecF